MTDQIKQQMGSPILQVKNLKKYFPVYSGIFRKKTDEIKAVDDISFCIKKGEIVGLVGESGSGKSTAARSAIRLLEPTSGSVHFNGENFLELSKEQLKTKRTKIQMIFQDPFASLNPRKTVKESIGESLLYHGIVKTEKEQGEEVANLLKKVGLYPEVMNRYPHEFSGGQQQRICIARAIILKPQLIVCDEVVSALDVSIQAQILNLLFELKEKDDLSYLFISHDLSVVHHFCDYILVLYQGKVVEEGSTNAIFKNPQHSYTKKLLKAIPKRHP